MAKLKLTFIDADYEDDTIKVSSDIEGRVSFYIEEDGVGTRINLDIATSIKFYKTLRHEINKAKEVQDGNR